MNYRYYRRWIESLSDEELAEEQAYREARSPVTTFSLADICEQVRRERQVRERFNAGKVVDRGR